MTVREKKVVVITGASKGIGCAAATLFNSRGCTVYALSRSGKAPEGVHSIVCDVTDGAKLKEAIDTIYAAEKSIDILVNNAGSGISGSAEKTTVNDARALFQLNFFSVFEAIKYTVPYMRNQGGGTIVNIGSVAGTLHVPFQTFYSAAKAAVEALSNCLRGELAPFNIKVTTVLPGDTRTSFTEAREKKFDADDPDYGARIQRSITVMENDERNGMRPEEVAKVIYQAALRKNPKPAYIAGFKYRLFIFLNRLLPKQWVLAILNGIYAK